MIVRSDLEREFAQDGALSAFVLTGEFVPGSIAEATLIEELAKHLTVHGALIDFTNGALQLRVRFASGEAAAIADATSAAIEGRDAEIVELKTEIDTKAHRIAELEQQIALLVHLNPITPETPAVQ